MNRKVYKVCAYTSKKPVFASVVAEGIFRLYYKIGETTKPNIGSLMAFSRYDVAKRFAHIVDAQVAVIILYCDAVVSANQPAEIPLSLWVDDPTPFEQNQVIEWWAGPTVEKWGPGYFRLQKPPVGTVFCDSITPLRMATEELDGKAKDTPI